MNYMTQFRFLPHLRLGNLPETSETTLSKGSDGNHETVSIIRKIAYMRAKHPLIRQLAMNIIEDAKLPSHYYLSECAAIGNYVRTYVRYLKDPKGCEQLTDPVLLVKKIQQGNAMGDCDDMSLLLCSLLLAAGHQPYVRIVKYKNTLGPFNHIYVVVYEQDLGKPKQRLVLDAIVKHKPLGYEVNQVYGKEIKI